jgi:serpin B
VFKAYCEALNTDDPNGSCDKVNAYISDKTAGMIKNMLSPRSFGPALLLI